MYEILLRRKILEKLVTTRKGGKVDVFLKTKWNLRGNPFSLFLLNISQHYFKCSILLPPPFLDTKYHYVVIKTDDELFQVLPP